VSRLDPLQRDPLMAYWSRSVADLMTALRTTGSGLSVAEADARALEFGRNALEAKKLDTTARLFLQQFRSPLILILVFAALVAAVVRDWPDALIVLSIVLASGTLSFSQEHRASTAFEQLRKRVQITCTVVRDGIEQTVPSESIVPGDIVVLRAGSLIPADSMLIEARDLFVTQAALTGEPMPVEKRPGTCAADAGLAARTNTVFMGTSVRSGTGRAIVVRTGAATIFGDIATRLKLRPPETEFGRGIRQFGQLLTQFMAVLTIIVFATNVLLDRSIIESLLFAIALAVGISPELLPAIISITLSAGAREMAARGVIVRRLNAIENFGSMDILCSDKTGTLTEGSMALQDARALDGDTPPQLLVHACLNAHLQTGLQNPLDEAIVAAGDRQGIDVSQFRKVDEIPYDFVRKRLTVVVEEAGAPDRMLITKGALASVLECCSLGRSQHGVSPLDTDARNRIQTQFEQWSADGYRVLGLASKSVAARANYTRDDECELCFDGFLLFMDPPKAGIRETLAALSASGVRLKIITGDNRFVTAHLAANVGLDSPRMLTGAELNELREEALMHTAPLVDLFVEMDPNQKERIILALKKAGHVVGYLGDGINDASALHAADIGISVDQAVDVAKEAADFVLLEHDLEILLHGVRQGRKTFANTLKYISITTSANFGNMISMAVASLFLPFLPLLAKQILLNNFLSDFPSMAIANDRVDPEILATPQRWNVASIRNFMAVFGAVSSFFDFLTFGILLYVFRAGPELFRTGWFIESLLTELVIVLVVRTRLRFYASKPGRLLLWSTVATMALTVLVPFLPGARSFGFVPLTSAQVAVLVLITMLYAGASEATKSIFYRGQPSRA
jgi:Mg2+-importing ATPase